MPGGFVSSPRSEVRSDQSILTTEATRADGGNIQLMAGSLVQLIDSQLTATSRSGLGQEGNILLSSPLVVLDRSQIRTQAFGGPGETSTSGRRCFWPRQEVVSASSALELIAAVTTLSGTLAPLPQTFVHVQPSCPSAVPHASWGPHQQPGPGQARRPPLTQQRVAESSRAGEKQLVADPALTGVRPPRCPPRLRSDRPGEGLAPAGRDCAP